VAAHEEGAGFMADGYARVSGRFGVCTCIGGPGAGNILPAAIAAYSDRSRVLFLTGDVPTTLQGRGAFQDGSMEGTRDTAFLRLATTFSEEVELISQFPRQLAAAFRAMGGVPPGPVHLSVPTDIQKAELRADTFFPTPNAEPARPVDLPALVRAAERVLAGAGKVAVLAGRGCVASGAGEALVRHFLRLEVVPQPLQDELVATLGLPGFVQLAVVINYYRLIAGLALGFEFPLPPGMSAPFR
jgi:acetolactate synthase-1/2/3 large subunit